MFRLIGHMAIECPRAQWFLERARGRRVLDLGFVGINQHLLHDRIAELPAVGEIFGLDVDGEAVRSARLPGTLAGDARALPFADGAFDLVLAGELLEHVVPYEPIVSEAYRVLAPGGRLCLSTPNGFDGLKLLRWWLLPRRTGRVTDARSHLGHPTHRHILNPPSLLAQLDDHGFEVVDCQIRRFRIPLVFCACERQLVLTWRLYPFSRLGEFLCVEARKPSH